MGHWLRKQLNLFAKWLKKRLRKERPEAVWMWRRGHVNRWHDDKSPDNPEHVRSAAADIRIRASSGEQGLSVFRVLNEEEAQKVAVLYVFTVLGFDRPDKIEYLLIPTECFKDLGLHPQAVRDDHLHWFLSERHHEIVGLNDHLSEELARRILMCSQRRAMRF
jgi:hypothetical protein